MLLLDNDEPLRQKTVSRSLAAQSWPGGFDAGCYGVGYATVARSTGFLPNAGGTPGDVMRRMLRCESLLCGFRTTGIVSAISNR